MAEMYHPELDVTVAVRDRAVERYESKGWRRVEDAGPTDEEFAAMAEEVVPAGGEEEEE
jgi:hypothetical protein